MGQTRPGDKVCGRRGCTGRVFGRQDARVVRVEERVVVEDVQVEGAVVFVERLEGTPGPSDGCTRTFMDSQILETPHPLSQRCCRRLARCYRR